MAQTHLTYSRLAPLGISLLLAACPSPTDVGGLIKLPDGGTEPQPDMATPPADRPTGTLVIASDQSTSNTQLYVVPLDNPMARRLLTQPPAGSRDNYPAFSLDGSQIVFVRSGAMLSDPDSLRIINTDGTGERELAQCAAPGAGTASCQAPVIAADGNVYYQDRYALQDGTRGGGIKYVGKGGGTPALWDAGSQTGYGCGLATTTHNKDGSKLVLRLVGDSCSMAGVFAVATTDTMLPPAVDPTMLRSELSYYANPVFNSDGSKLIFFGVDQVGGQYVKRLLAMNPDGTSLSAQLDLGSFDAVNTLGSSRLTSDGKYLIGESAGSLHSIATTGPARTARIDFLTGIATFDVK